MEVSPYSNNPVPVSPYQNAANVSGATPKPKMPASPSAPVAGTFGNNKKPVMSPYGKSPVGSTATAPAGPGTGLQCPPTQAGAIYDPQSVNVEDVYKPVIVQHIHPMHTEIRTHYVYEHQHYYPQSVSHTCDERHYDVQCGRPCFPKPHC